MNCFLHFPTGLEISASLLLFAPVGSYLYIQGHLDIEQVLILSQVLSHFTLQVPQLSVHVADGLLLRWKREKS